MLGTEMEKDTVFTAVQSKRDRFCCLICASVVNRSNPDGSNIVCYCA